MKNTVSIIIPAYNAEGTIRKCIEGSLNQNHKGPIEIIVVDDGSTDGTAEIIKSFKGIIYFHQENSGPASARNKGVSLSSGDIIFFTDSDCIPEKNWVSTGVEQLLDNSANVAAGSYLIANPDKILARCIHSEILYRHSNRMRDVTRVFGTYNCCIKRHVFEKLGGFNEAYRYPSGEDNDLSYRLINAAHKIYFNKSMLVKHYYTSGIYRYLREQKRHGFWRAKMHRDHPDMITGDDYTFWKDMIEPLLVIAILGSSLSCLLFLRTSCTAIFIIITLILLSTLFGLELCFAFVIIKHLRSVLFWSYVMFLRAFARCYGYILGVFYFRLLKMGIKNK